IAVQNALFFRRLEVRRLLIPRCSYPAPELAHVGYSPEYARSAGFEVDTLTVPMAENDRAVLDGEETGFLRLHLRRGSDRMLGATVVSSHAGELISEISLAITHKLGLRKLGGVIRPYPTRGEVLSRACGQWQRGRLGPGLSKILETFFGIFR
ncbi:MAG: FAD-containing oxidoreductase, partial [Planctomycetes bacterium]|nr:FAD-containing oxidoreductase [Planctomycetota bacterium]